MSKFFSILSITTLGLLLLIATCLVAADTATSSWDVSEVLKGEWKVENVKYSNGVQSAHATEGMMAFDVAAVSGLRGNYTEEELVAQTSEEEAVESELATEGPSISDLKIIATSPRTGTFRFLKHSAAETSGLLDEMEQDIEETGEDNTLVEFDYAFDISALSGYAVSEGIYRDLEIKKSGLYQFTFVSKDAFILTLTQQTGDNEYKITRMIGQRANVEAPASFFSRYGTTIMLFAAMFLPRMMGLGQPQMPGPAPGAAPDAPPAATQQQQ